MPPEGRSTTLDWETGIPLASGGSADVVRVWCRALDRDIAVKYLKTEEPGAIARLLREAETQRRLRHPHIVRVHDTGIHRGHHCIAMDLVDGQPVNHALEGADQDTRLAVFEQILGAVALAHEKGVTHRDLKPANVLVEQKPEGWHAWVMDFGLARQTEDVTLTVTGHAVGTPGYMAPEQARGEKYVDARADVFALGVMLYQLFAGSLPFDADTPMAMILQAASGRTVPIAGMRRRLPEGLARIVAQCLEFRPRDRYANAGKLLADIRAFRQGQDLQARHIGRFYKLQRWSRRNPALALTGLAAFLLVAASAAATFWNWQQSASELAHVRTLIASAERVRSDWYIDQMRPVHDQSETRKNALAALVSLERETEQVGARASAEVHSAMADLHYELGHYDRALALAAAAWHSGLDQPGVASRAARALLRMHNQNRIQRSLVVEPELLPELDRQAHENLLDALSPYRDHLPGNTARLTEVILDQSGDGVLRLLEAYQPITPDDWDSIILLAQNQSADAASELAQNTESGQARIERIDRVLARLLDTARSSAAAHLLRCQLAAIEANALNTGHDPDSDASRTRTGHCEIGLQIRGNDPELLAARAYWLWQTAKRRRLARQDYVDLLDEAIELSERALRLSPDQHSARLALGTALQIKGRWAMGSGAADPMTYLEAALAVLQQAHEAFPGSVNIINNLALTWNNIAARHHSRGDFNSGEAASEEAIRWMRRAAVLRPDDRRQVHNAMATESFLLYDRQKRGVYDRSAHDRLDAGLESLIERFPDYATPYNTLALLWWGLAEFQQRSGKDPNAALDRAEHALRRLLSINADHESGQINLAGVLRQRYAFAVLSQRPTDERDADEALAIYWRLEKPDAPKREFGCLIAEILHARAKRHAGAGKRELLDEAERISRIDDNIGWLQIECRCIRPLIAMTMHAAEIRPETVTDIWQETEQWMQQVTDEASTLHASAMLASALGHADLSGRWASLTAAANPQFAAHWAQPGGH